MTEWFVTFIIVALVMFLLSVWYQLTPAKKMPGRKPYLAIFPKYRFPIEDLSEFTRKLESLGFKQHAQDLFARGHVFGDFSAKWIQLTVRVDQQSRTATIGSPFIAIAFDTGDIWKIANDLKT